MTKKPKESKESKELKAKRAGKAGKAKAKTKAKNRQGMMAYKGFTADMTCRNFQYEEGGKYTTGKAELCKSGFHACENPVDCFRYYPPAISVYHKVKVSGSIVKDTDTDNTKVAATRIKIGARLDMADLCYATVDFVRSRCTSEHNAEPGKPVTAGDFGAATAGNEGVATAGHHGIAAAGHRGTATAGSYSAATAGYSGVAMAGRFGVAMVEDLGAAVAGYCGIAMAKYGGAAVVGDKGVAMAADEGIAMAGDHGTARAKLNGIAAVGYHGTAMAGDEGIATAGECGTAATGSYGVAVSKGRVAVGMDGIGCVRGDSVCAKGGLGSVLVIVEENPLNYKIKFHATIVIDGEHYKPDTWYRFDENGSIVEAGDFEYPV